MADDFTGVPTELWRDLRDRIAGLNYGLCALAFFLGILVAILLNKGVISWADFGLVSRG